MTKVGKGLKAEFGERCVAEEVYAVSDSLVGLWEEVAEEGEGVAAAGGVCCCVAERARWSHGGYRGKGGMGGDVTVVDVSSSIQLTGVVRPGSSTGKCSCALLFVKSHKANRPTS
jgi:hypothetical protein